MNPVFNTYIPDGFSTVGTYIFSEEPYKLIDFLKEAFYAEELHQTMNPSNGDLANCILKVGHSCIMISQARGQFMGMCSAYYLYVDDVDAVYEKAIANGAQGIFEAADMDYGDRQAGIKDPFGNYWWISKRLVEKGYQS